MQLLAGDLSCTEILEAVLSQCCYAAANSMGTLINGADAGVAIITSAVAAANATLIRAHQLVGQVDSMANEWAQSPVGSIIGQPP